MSAIIEEVTERIDTELLAPLVDRIEYLLTISGVGRKKLGDHSKGGR